MSEKTENAIFVRDVQRRLDELINWIVESSPTTNIALLPNDFSEARKLFYQVATGDSKLQYLEPEPEEGGAQYINDNPAPWP